MSQRSVERALGKMVTDETFRREFFRDPERHEPCVPDSISCPRRWNALRRAPRAMLAELGASLEDRICRLAMPDEAGGTRGDRDETTDAFRTRAGSEPRRSCCSRRPGSLAGCTQLGGR